MTEEYDGHDPLGDVVSWNLRRRHLSEAQRTSVAAKLANMPAHRPNKGANLHPSLVSQAQAAEMLNVSERSVNTAKKIHAVAIPEITEKVDVGDMSLRAAAIAAKLANMKVGGDRPSKSDSNFDSANLQNRNEISRAQAAEMLNEAQRTSVAAKLANIKNGGDRRSDQNANLHSGLVSREQAAEMLNEAQRASVAAKLANIHKGDYCGNQYEVSANLQTPQVPRSQAAEMLNVSERASVAAKLANMKHGGDRKSDQAANLRLDVSQAQAAEMLNVSEQ